MKVYMFALVLGCVLGLTPLMGADPLVTFVCGAFGVCMVGVALFGVITEVRRKARRRQIMSDWCDHGFGFEDYKERR